jgi:hypothetical protein
MTQLVSSFAMYVPSDVAFEALDGLEALEHETKRQMQAKMAKEVNFAVYSVPCKLDVHTSLTLPPSTKSAGNVCNAGNAGDAGTNHHAAAGLLMGKRRGVTFATEHLATYISK